MTVRIETPERYVLIKIQNESTETLHILSGWNGSYLSGASWRLSTQIISITSVGDGYFRAETRSGTVYTLSPHGVGLTSWTSSILKDLKTKDGFAGVITDKREVFEYLVESSEGCIHPDVPV